MRTKPSMAAALLSIGLALALGAGCKQAPKNAPVDLKAVAAALAQTAQQLLLEGKPAEAQQIIVQAALLDPSSKFIVGLKTQAARPPEAAAPAAGAPESPPVPLEAELTDNGMHVTFESYELGKTAHAFNSTLTQALEPDELWLLVRATVMEQGNQPQAMRWRDWVHTFTAAGVSMAPTNYMRQNFKTAPGTEDTLDPNERDGLAFCFRLRKDDFPVQLVFQDNNRSSAILWPDLAPPGPGR